MKRIIGTIMVLAGAGLAAGCASTAPLSLMYAPSAAAGGGSGDVFLKTAPGKADPNIAKIRWVLGKKKNADGEVTGDILSAFSPEDMAGDALRQELAAAGYRVECGPALPAGVRKGIALSDIRIAVDEVAGVPKVDANGTVKVSMDLWKEGNLVKHLSFEANASDFAVIARNDLPREIVQEGLRQVMGEAVPEIVKALK